MTIISVLRFSDASMILQYTNGLCHTNVILSANIIVCALDMTRLVIHGFVSDICARSRRLPS
jgi:hypothetical protein